MARLLLHIGYHKTATTWLQQLLFNDREKGFWSSWGRGQIASNLIKVDALTFDHLATRARYEAEISNRASDELVAVMSHERLSGYPASGGFDSKLIADRLAACFGEAQILIVIREQKSAIKSWYAQYIRDGGSLPLRRFLEPPQGDLLRAPLFSREFYKYDSLIGYYNKIFTQDMVLVLPFEMLVRDPDSFVERIVRHVGVEEIPSLSIERRNKGKGVLRSIIGRYSNRMFSWNQLNSCALVDWPQLNETIWSLGSLVSRVVPAGIEDYFERRTEILIEEYVSDYFRESNRKTSALTGIDLHAFNYDC